MATEFELSRSHAIQATVLYHPMRRIRIRAAFTLYCYIILGTSAASEDGQCSDGCVILSRSDDQNCDLNKTPLSRCGGYRQFMKSDAILNEEYRRLFQQLKLIDRKSLQKAQREWIMWRDEQCETEEVEANCDNGVCAGVAHDSCILDLTARRAKELRRFTQENASGVDSGFAFSKGRTDRD
ncbi:lysozyme inhibitor LprI family protein [Pseudoduganella flava]|uniref:DUF1311 domain-containing protein n=1 Tax=Pseudoduganella flava TaxID=871742 RepID=A0ABX6FQI9_9BURK|nr:lysozyme inhibitor LprI family protein [Pseudoduganella flava]QGZ37652.1 DUF1311 domain-containing protein [Pseudoduganella flava]